MHVCELVVISVAGLKSAVRFCLLLLLGCWTVVFVNYAQLLGGAIWFTQGNQMGLAWFLFCAPLIGYGLIALLVSSTMRVLMVFGPILFWLVCFPVFGLTLGGLSSVLFKIDQQLLLFEMQLVKSETIDDRSKLCTYEGFNEDWNGRKFKILRRETQLAPGLAWVKTVPENAAQKQ